MKFFSLLHQDTVHLATDDKIILAEDFSTLMSSEEILSHAKLDAEHYRTEVTKECEELKKTAKEKGFEEGLAQFNEQILLFERNLRHLQIELQKQILPLALKAAKKIVGKELELHPETIVEIVLQTLTPVTQSRKIAIYVNKAEKEALEANRPRIKELLNQVQTLIIQDRADVSPGGCIIETESGIINASIENQWRSLEAAFEKYMKH